MRQYKFRALVMLDPAGDDAARCGTPASCLVEPSRYSYFPAVISTGKELPGRTVAQALVTIALHASEAGAFFGPGQRFTIWADAVVGHTIQVSGPLGYGIICQPASAHGPHAASRGTAAGLRLTRSARTCARLSR